MRKVKQFASSTLLRAVVLVLACACVSPDSAITTGRCRLRLAYSPDVSTPVDPAEDDYPLVATDDVLMEQCQAAADLLQFAVPCPSALPATNNPVRCEIPGAFRDSNITPKEGCALGRAFLLEPTGIQDLELFHLIVEGGKDERSGCGMDEEGQAVQLGDRGAMLFACGEFSGLHANHTLVRFQEDDVFVDVSAHGHTELNERAVLSIAEAIQMVPPA